MRLPQAEQHALLQRVDWHRWMPRLVVFAQRMVGGASTTDPGLPTPEDVVQEALSKLLAYERTFPASMFAGYQDWNEEEVAYKVYAGCCTIIRSVVSNERIRARPGTLPDEDLLGHGDLTPDLQHTLDDLWDLFETYLEGVLEQKQETTPEAEARARQARRHAVCGEIVAWWRLDRTLRARELADLIGVEVGQVYPALPIVKKALTIFLQRVSWAD